MRKRLKRNSLAELFCKAFAPDSSNGIVKSNFKYLGSGDTVNHMDWDIMVADKRVQVIKETEVGVKGTLQFGIVIEKIRNL